ncbi:hypothetical protein HK100_008824 [Physocladia obscura]|uniref:TIR domain-containing protein n=1 Tax=Physocladia obscura TaxID=109957 RepID=A0AAD5SQ96_9FUNG|nr:hypothetical protein HK100_008824 [Physocladia obscura]
MVKAIQDHIPELDIWMDIHHMEDNINKGMAKGIADSAVVIVCMCKEYLTSENCNLEIQFAKDLKKKRIAARFFSESDDEIAEYSLNSEMNVPFLLTTGALHANFKEFLPGCSEWKDAVEIVVKQIKILVPRFKQPSVNSSDLFYATTS